MFDLWILLAIENIDYVYQWRLEAEIYMKNQGLPCLSNDEVGVIDISIVFILC